MTTKANVYEMVTDRIIAELEKGNIPWRWQKPWTGVRSGAYNRITKKPYSIINQILLKYSGEYATFKQWSDLGGHIKKVRNQKSLYSGRYTRKKKQTKRQEKRKSERYLY